jgi:hypothetical protein
MKLKETLMIAVGALAFMLITGIAKSDEKTYTPQETIEAFASVPGKVSNHVKNEWQDIKVYQAKSWAEMKTKWPWNVLLKGKNDTQN